MCKNAPTNSSVNHNMLYESRINARFVNMNNYGRARTYSTTTLPPLPLPGANRNFLYENNEILEVIKREQQRQCDKILDRLKQTETYRHCDQENLRRKLRKVYILLITIFVIVILVFIFEIIYISTEE